MNTNHSNLNQPKSQQDNDTNPPTQAATTITVDEDNSTTKPDVEIRIFDTVPGSSTTTYPLLPSTRMTGTVDRMGTDPDGTSKNTSDIVDEGNTVSPSALGMFSGNYNPVDDNVDGGNHYKDQLEKVSSSPLGLFPSIAHTVEMGVYEDQVNAPTPPSQQQLQQRLRLQQQQRGNISSSAPNNRTTRPGAYRSGGGGNDDTTIGGSLAVGSSTISYSSGIENHGNEQQPQSQLSEPPVEAYTVDEVSPSPYATVPPPTSSLMGTQPPIVQAERVVETDPPPAPTPPPTRRRQRTIILIIAIVFIGATTGIAGYFLGQGDTKVVPTTEAPSISVMPSASFMPSMLPSASPLPSQSPSYAPSSSPSSIPSATPTATPTRERLSLILELFEDITGPDIISQPTSPQYRALEFLAQIDCLQLPLENGIDWTFLVERFALVTIAYSSNIPWNDGFDDGKSHCDYFLEASFFDLAYTDGRVSALGFLDYSLMSTLPSEVGLLTSLESLGIASNGLISLPSEIGMLKSLRSLYIANNDLTGLPSEIGMLTSLTSLGIGFNDLTDLPSEIGMLTSLTRLAIDLTSLTILHSKIGLLASLRSLQLGGNGTMPVEFQIMTSLTSLSLAGGMFHGTIPSETGKLSSLRNLNLSSNSFTGSVPTEFGLLRQLSWINLYNNELTGVIPSELGGLTKLLDFNVGSNSLVGTIPTELGLLVQLTSLHLQHNDFTQIMPDEICNLKAEASLGSLHFDCSMANWEGKCDCCGCCDLC